MDDYDFLKKQADEIVAKRERKLVEAVAKAVYEQWADRPGYVPWVPGGNSHKQDDARRIARDALAFGVEGKTK